MQSKYEIFQGEPTELFQNSTDACSLALPHAQQPKQAALIASKNLEPPSHPFCLTIFRFGFVAVPSEGHHVWAIR